MTKVKDYRNGTVGYVEAAMKMDTMFYEMYAGNEKEWTCFMAEDGTLYMGNSNSKSAVHWYRNCMKELRTKRNRLFCMKKSMEEI